MIDPDNYPEIVPMFQADYRGSGLLLHIASLPSPYGIGDVGPAALSWIDRLHATGQSWWQALPLGPGAYGDSLYLGSSSFAANGLLISPDLLIRDELLSLSDCEGHSFQEAFIDYDVIVPFKNHLLDIAWAKYKAGARRDLKADFEQFRHLHSYWLEDFALFRALKATFGGAHYLEWPEELVQRVPVALEQAGRELADQVDRVCFAQFLLFRGSLALKEYAHARGVRLVGDLPFFVSPDSSDVWSRPEYFLLDENRRPRYVAGVPPDNLSSLGHQWGNPVYNWEALREAGYRWCIERFRAMLAHVDVIRLDHFRGFAAAWHVPAGAPSARCGQWTPGPGYAFFAAVQHELGSLPFLAEDLGMITADVWHLLDQIGAPGTRVLQLAFDGHSDNLHLPENYVVNTVAYTGTHVGPATRAWYEKLPARERRNLWRHMRQAGGEPADAAPALMRLAWSSRAAVAMAPLQDLLNLAPETITNSASITAGKCCWRVTEEMLRAPAFEWLGKLTKSAKRTPLKEFLSQLEFESSRAGVVAKELSGKT